ncbi:hypothetical protein MMC13_007480 [Lambiella insularis]|nr:hypothetical protein [Lambiella insularis]
MSWRIKYLQALQARDNQEQVNRDVFDAYTRLADRAAALPLPAVPADGDTTDLRGAQTAAAAESTTKVVRQNLVDAQRNREELETHLRMATNDLEKLQLKSKAEREHVNKLTAEKTALTKKLKDRDEELRGKSKLLESVHDETLSLTIELNMVEEQNKRLQSENKELVDRWMARKGQEADAMNSESKFS